VLLPNPSLAHYGCKNTAQVKTIASPRCGSPSHLESGLQDSPENRYHSSQFGIHPGLASGVPDEVILETSFYKSNQGELFGHYGETAELKRYSKEMKKISIILPCYNEGENLLVLFDALRGVQQECSSYEWELIFVRDDTWKSIQALATTPTVKAIRFARNFGHQATLEAGLQHATGDAVVMMGADLQHPPALIPKLVAEWEAGHLIINTKRIDSGSGAKHLSSGFFYRVINAISDTRIEPGSADFRLLDRALVDELNRLSEKNKFYRGLISWIGFEPVFIPYAANQCLYGKPSYSLRKMFHLARVGVTSFSIAPMRFIVVIGSVIFLLGALLCTVMLVDRIVLESDYFGGAAILAAFIITNNGFLIMIFGIMSIYQIAMHKELQDRPNYIVRESVNIARS
jgi:polyisoprenyl-phosphate glycosyltransferase